MSVFSERLQKRRLLKGWNKSATAQKLGISAQRYANWEYGSREPDYEMLNKIADIFGTTTDYLTGKTDDPSPRSSNLSSTDLADMLDNVRSYDGKAFDEHDKELLTTFLKGLYADK